MQRRSQLTQRDPTEITGTRRARARALTQGREGRDADDALDLRDLLVDEREVSLTEYLYVEAQAGSTIIHVSTKGGFSDGVYDNSLEDQTIELSGVDFVTPFGGDQDAIIQDLISRGKLITDL